MPMTEAMKPGLYLDAWAGWSGRRDRLFLWACSMTPWKEVGQ